MLTVFPRPSPARRLALAKAATRNIKNTMSIKISILLILLLRLLLLLLLPLLLPPLPLLLLACESTDCSFLMRCASSMTMYRQTCLLRADFSLLTTW